MSTSKIEGKLTCLHNFGSANLSCNTNTTCKPIFSLNFLWDRHQLFTSLEEAIVSPAVSELVAQSCISTYCNLWNICEVMRHYFSDCSLDQGTFKKQKGSWALNVPRIIIHWKGNAPRILTTIGKGEVDSGSHRPEIGTDQDQKEKENLLRDHVFSSESCPSNQLAYVPAESWGVGAVAKIDDDDDLDTARVRSMKYTNPKRWKCESAWCTYLETRNEALNIESGETEVCKKSQKKLEEDREEDGRAGGFLYFRKGAAKRASLIWNKHCKHLKGFGANIANSSTKGG